jgi:uncharacterized protein YfaS (alpha-2-macroglobulin family)
VGLTEYLKNQSLADKPSTVTISLDGATVSQSTLSGEPDEQPLHLELPIRSLQPGQRSLTIEASGPCFYTVELSQFDVQPSFLTNSQPGFKIERHYFRLAPRTNPDGSESLMPLDNDQTTFNSGELIRVVLTVTTDQPWQFLQVEDPLPSNCHVMDQGDVGADDWNWWWSDTVVRDDRIAMFSRWMNAGANKLEYTMRAESPGKASALPAVAENMYEPDQRATTADSALEVEK